MASYKKIITRTAPFVLPLLVLGIRYWLGTKRRDIELAEDGESGSKSYALYDLIDNILSSVPRGRFFR